MTKNYQSFGSGKSVWPENEGLVVTDYVPPPPKSGNSILKMFNLLLLLLVFVCGNTFAQVNTYSFAASAGNFTPLVAGTSTGLDATSDDAISSAFNIGFNFSYDNLVYTQVMASSNGTLLFGTGKTQSVTNSLATSVGTERPGVAPLWDDLQCTQGITYQLSGSAPNRVLTVEWLNMEWDYASGTGAISFQVKLYETTNEIQIVYRSEAAAYSNFFSSGASVGLMGMSASDFISVSSLSAAPTTSTSVSTNGINAKPVSGQTFTFAPPPPPPCVMPGNLEIAQITTTSANLNWSASATATAGYEWELRTSGAGGSGAAGLVASGTTTGLTAASGTVASGTSYTLYVRSNCETVGFSTWATSAATYIGYCKPTTVYGCTDGDVIARVILNTLDNNSGTGCPSQLLGYSDYTSNPTLTTTLQAGSTYNCTVYAGQYSEGYAAWIDYNDDGLFSNSERIGYSIGQVAGSTIPGQLGSSATFPIVLSCSPPLGEHRLRVRAMFATSGIDVTPCGNNNYGEIEDYVITITAADACPAPSGLSASNPTSSSGDLAWNAGCEETNWEIVVQAQGLGIPTGAGTPLSTNSYSAQDLPAGYAYEFYVRANCIEDGFSTWAGPYVFTKAPCPVLTYPVNAAPAVEIVDASITLDWEASFSATSYVVYIGTAAGDLDEIVTVPDTSVEITGFDYSTTYFWMIVPISPQGTTEGCTEFSFTTQDLPANDICSGALSLDSLTAPLTSTTVNLTHDYSPSCSTSSTGPDAFYSISVPANYTLAIGQTANNYDSVASVFYGSCSSQTEINCTDDPDTLADDGELVEWTNTTGSTQTVYYVQDGYSEEQGIFVLTWTLSPPPVAITGFTPEYVCGNLGGTEFTISGSNFTDATAVEFNGIAATSFSVINDTTITAVAPAGDIAGAITVYKQPSVNGSGDSATPVAQFAQPVVAEISNGNATLCIGDTVDLDNASPGGTWSSSDEAIAAIDADGIVTAYATGSVTISYSVTDNGCTTNVTTSVSVNGPVEATSPIAQTVTTGNDAQFSVTASGTVAGYQWQVSVDGGGTFVDLSEAVPYSGTQTNTLVIDNTPDTLNGNYYRVVVLGTSPCADFESAAAILNVGDTGIAMQPEPVVQCSTNLMDAVYTVVPSGTVNSYQWQEDQGLGFVALTDGTSGDITYQGTDTATLTVSGLDNDNSGYAYRVILTGPANAATSNNATFSLNDAVVISTPPSSMSVCYSGGSAIFSATASGDTSGFMWQYSSDNVNFNNVSNGTPAGAAYAGSNTANLTVTTTAATPQTSHFFRLVAMGASPCGNVASEGAQLIFVSPEITSQPSASSVSNGNSTSFTVATSAPSPTYQWQYATAAGGPWSNVTNATPAAVTYSGAATATLTVNAAAAAAGSTARYYRAVVTSNGCSVNSNAAQLSIFSYCAPVASSSSTYISNFTTTGGLTNINNTSVASGGYSTFLNLSASQYPGYAINFATTVVGNTVGASVWVDFNNNYAFDSGERLFNTPSSYVTNPSGSFTIPAATAPGNYRMRILIDWNNNNPTNPCTIVSSSRGEAEDYILTVVAIPGCSGTPTAAVASALPSFVCGTGSVTLTASGYNTIETGLSLQWYNSETGLIPGATNPTYVTPSISAPTSYFVRVICANGGAFSDSNTVPVNIVNPTVVSTVPNSRCGTGTVTLEATAGAGEALNWYASATGGSAIGSGASFTTPPISTTTTYYVAAGTGQTSAPVMTYCASTSTSTLYYITGFSTTGGVSNIANTATVQSANGYGNYTAMIASQYPGSTVNYSVTWPGTSTYGVSVFIDWNNDGDFNDTGEKASGTLNYANSPYNASFTVPANATLGSKRMRVKIDFLSATPGACGTSTTTETEDYTFIVAACESARTAVVATVETPPALTLSSASASICTGSATPAITLTSNAADYDSFVWAPTTGISGNVESGWVFNATASGNYVLTATSSVSGCSTSTAFALTVNPLPQTFTVAPVVLCSTDAPVPLTMNFGQNPISGACTVVTYSSPYPATTSTASTCDGVAVTTLATDCYTGEYSNVAAAASMRYVFTSTGSGDTVTITNANGSTVLAAGPSPLVYVNETAQTVRFYSQQPACGEGVPVNRTRSYRCLPVLAGVWSPAQGLYADAAGTVAYNGAPAFTVYAKPLVTTPYSITATSGAGCSRSAATSVMVNNATEWFVDADNDNYGDSDLPTVFACAEPALYAAVGGDCDDAAVAVNPGQPEIFYNGIDDNCDGNLDEGNQIVSQVLASQCATTLTSISSIIGAVSFGAPVNGYRFKVVNTVTNAEQTIDRTAPHFSLTMLTNADYATTYSVSVMLRRNGVWLGYYGPSCLISTPAILDAGGAAAINPSQCGIVLPTLSTLIATTSIPGVTGYRFRVTNLTDGSAPNAQQVLERNINWFSLTMLTRFNYGTEYQIEVGVKTNGEWSGYGAPCNVSSPEVPKLTNCGAVIASPSTLIATTSLNRVTAYRFEITNLGSMEQVVVDRSNNFFSFSNVPGFEPGGVYGVRVAVQTSGQWSPFGEICEITAPGAARSVVKDEVLTTVDFRAVVYPNPYVESFAFDMDTSSDEDVQVKVYDMVGKLIDEREFAIESIEMQQFGERYPSGVYSIVLSQAGFVKTLRVIKR